MNCLLSLLFAGASLLAQTPDAGKIMRRAAENVDRAQAAQAAWRAKRAANIPPLRPGKERRDIARKMPISTAGWSTCSPARSCGDGNSLGGMVYWFPVESKNLEKYAFQYEREQRYSQKEDFWEGEGLIERNEFQPVLVTSARTGKGPTAVNLQAV